MLANLVKGRRLEQLFRRLIGDSNCLKSPVSGVLKLAGLAVNLSALSFPPKADRLLFNCSPPAVSVERHNFPPRKKPGCGQEMEVLTQLRQLHQHFGLRAHLQCSYSQNRHSSAFRKFQSDRGLAGWLNLQRSWDWSRLARSKAARSCCGVAAFADPSPEVVEEKGSVDSQGVAGERARKPRQSVPAQRSPVSLSKPSGDEEQLTDPGKAGELKGSDGRKKRSSTEGKDGAQAKRVAEGRPRGITQTREGEGSG